MVVQSRNLMALPMQHRMEQLHVAYVTAVAALGGATYDLPGRDYGIDGIISEIRRLPDGSFRPSGWHVDCQLKATTKFKVQPESIVYQMDVEAYNRFVCRDGPTPRILIVFCLPPEWQNWLSISEQELVLKHCCYWTTFSGSQSSNVSSKAIYLPRKNVFSPEAIQRIFETIKRGEELDGTAP